MLKRMVRLATLFLLTVLSGCISTPIRFTDNLPTITTRDIEAAGTGRSVSISILSDPASEDVPKGALARLRQESGLPISVRFEGGIPVFLDGAFPLPPGFSDDPVLRALEFLARHRDLYRLEDPRRQLFLIRIAKDELGSHLFFGQRHKDLTILGAELAVHLEKAAVLGTNGRYLPEIPELRPAALSREDAEAKALAAVPGGEPEVQGESQLVIFKPSLFGIAGDEGTLLAWRVTAQGQRKDGLWTSWRVLVDAADGRVLLLLDETRQHAPHMDFAIYTANGSERHDCGGRGLTQWFDANGQIRGSAPDAEGEAARDHLDTTYRYFFDNFHRHSWDNHERQTEVILDSASTSNAFFDPNCKHLVFSDGFAVLDMLAHEFTHAVENARQNGPLVYMDESGALSESYADVFGALVDADDWTIGEDLPWPSGCCADEAYSPGTWRDLSNPPACNCPGWPSTPDHLSNLQVLRPDITIRRDDNDWGYVHFNSGIPNKAAYLLIQGGTHYGVTVQGIRRAKVGRLYYDILTNYLTATATLREARDVTVSVARTYARSRYREFGEFEACSVNQAFAAVGLGDSDIDCDWVPDGRDNCPRQPNTDQSDRDGDGAGDRCDSDPDGDRLEPPLDNCPNIYNPDLEDGDGDEVGDACDNCPDVPNPEQEDRDGNGRGYACDEGEQIWSLLGRFHVRVTEERIVRIPFPPCLTCPPWLPEGFWTQVIVKAEKGWRARVIDEEGAVLAMGTGKAKQVLRFYPRSDSVSPLPWVTAIQEKAAIPLQPVAAKRYFLELVPPPNLEPGMEAEVELALENGIQEPK